MVNEIRRDYLLNRWVILAAERGKRPTDFRSLSSKEDLDIRNCPFCPGNEKMTPPSFLLYISFGDSVKKDKDSDGKRVKNWSIRCVANLYPALEVKETSSMTEDELYWRRAAVGSHEIIIESPNHYEHLHNASSNQLELLVNAYIDRLRSLSHWEYVSIFRNHKKEGGTSLSHPHSQIIATAIIPKLILEEFKASKEYFKKKDTCCYCDILKAEEKSPRLIYKNDNFVAFTPWASIFSFEFWIMPKKHQQTLSQLNSREIKDFAKTLRVCFSGIAKALNDPPYNYGFHIAPPRMKSKHFHWHLEVYPILTTHAGFEKNFHMYINTMPPETAAETLRDSLED